MKTEAKSIWSWLIKGAHSVAPDVFCLPASQFDVSCNGPPLSFWLFENLYQRTSSQNLHQSFILIQLDNQINAMTTSSLCSEWQGFSAGRNLLPLFLSPKTLTLGWGYRFSSSKRTCVCYMERRRRTLLWHMQFSSPWLFLGRKYTIECTD